MNCFYVIILLVVLRHASAQSGSGESVGVEKKVYTTKDILRAIEQEVEREHLGSGGSGSATGDDVEDALPPDQSGYVSDNTREGSPQTSTASTTGNQDENLSYRTVSPMVENGEGSEYNSDDDQTEPPSEEPSDGGKEHSRIEFAQFDKVADVMKKLKKSKTDEEMADKLRNGAKQVMHSIVNDMVTKTTQTVAPKIGSLVNSSLKSVSDNGIKMLNISNTASNRSNQSSNNFSKEKGYPDSELIKVQVQPVKQKQMTESQTPARASSPQEEVKQNTPNEVNNTQRKPLLSTVKVTVHPVNKTTKDTIRAKSNKMKTKSIHTNKVLSSAKAMQPKSTKISLHKGPKKPITAKVSFLPLQSMTSKLKSGTAGQQADTNQHSMRNRSKANQHKKIKQRDTLKDKQSQTRVQPKELQQNTRSQRKHSKKTQQIHSTDDAEIQTSVQAAEQQQDARGKAKLSKKTKTKYTIDNVQSQKGGHDKIALTTKKTESVKSKLKPKNEDLSTDKSKDSDKSKDIKEASKPSQGDSIKKELVANTDGESHEVRPMPVDPLEEVPGLTTPGVFFGHRLDAVQNEVLRLENELTVMQTAVAGVIKRLTDLEKASKDVTNSTHTTVIMGAQQHILMPGNESKPLPDTKEQPTIVTETFPENIETPTDNSESVNENNTQTPDTKETSPETPEETNQEEGYPENGISKTDEMPAENSTNNILKNTAVENKPLVPLPKPVQLTAPFPFADPFEMPNPFSSPIFIRYPQVGSPPSLGRRLKKPHQLIIPLAAIKGLQTQEEPNPETLQQSIDNEMPSNVYAASNNNDKADAAPMTNSPGDVEDEETSHQSLENEREPDEDTKNTKKVDVQNSAVLLANAKKLQNKVLLKNLPEVVQSSLKKQPIIADEVNKTGSSADDVSLTKPKNPSINKFYIQESNHPGANGQRKVAMELPQSDQQSDERRPIINIIVPNSETASLIQKEMCQTPCKNGGKCVGVNTCKCPALFSGNHCERFSLIDILKKMKKNKDNTYKPSPRHVRPIAVESRQYLPRRRQLSISDLLRLGAATAGYRLQNEREPITYEDQRIAAERGPDERKKSLIPRRIITRRNPITKRKQYILEI